MRHSPHRASVENRARAAGSRRQLVRVASSSVATLLVALACGSEDEEPEWRSKPARVEVMQVEPELLVDTAVFSGQLDAEHSVMLKPETEGIIETIEFQEGHEVTKDQTLFRLRSREQAARLREAQATRELAKQRWKRAQQLVKRDASSIAAADVANAEYEIAKARVELARIELDQTQVRAPFDGVVGMRLVDIGDRVEEDIELVRIDAVDRLQLTFGFSDEGLPYAKTGMKVKVWVRPYPGEKFPGEVFFVAPSLDPRNRRIWVKAWIDNPDRRLAPGLFANVDLEVRRVEGAIVLPESAIAMDRQGPFVWKIDSERKATRLPIEIGLRERGIVEVVQGLPAGTSIVSAGTNKVSEGKEVVIEENPLVGRARRTPPEGSLIGEGT